MSGAVAAPPLLNIGNMQEDEEGDPGRPPSPEELAPAASHDCRSRMDEDPEEPDGLPHTSKAVLSEAETRQIQEQAALVVDAQLRAMAVSSVRPAADSANTSTGTRSAGESVDDHQHDRLKPFVRTCKKFESGSGSGDQDGMISMEDGMDVAAKKRKTRRGKPKHRKLKPYSKQQLSYQQRLRCRATGRTAKTGRQPPAPYNTTQFLIEDHNDLPDLDKKIAGATGGSAVAAMAAEVHSHFSKPIAPPRTRDSSFSIDSDEDYFYSSPEDEEEFLTKEFSSAYEDLHVERLGTLSKSELIQEYIQLEAKVDTLTKRLRSRAAQSQGEERGDSRDAPEPKDSEFTKKLKTLQQRIDELIQQNEQLRRENELLRKQRHGSPMSSVDSESDSDSSSSNDEDGTDCSCKDHKTSAGSSPVPASYHARRDTNTNRRKSSVSSVDGVTDTSTGNSSGADASPKTSTGTNNTPTTTTTNSTDVPNGHATSFEIVALPT